MTNRDPDHAFNVDHNKVRRAWRAFMAYRGLSLQVCHSQAMVFDTLPGHTQSLISSVPSRLSNAAEAIEHNADIIERVATLANIKDSFSPDTFSRDQLNETIADFPDVVDALLAIVRDWSSTGKKDRMLAYDPIIRALQNFIDEAVTAGLAETRAEFKVLVPGASLGRLPWELSRLGIDVQGVENSYVQLFMCNYIVNGSATAENPLHIYPFTHHTGMVITVDEQIKEVKFPDTNPRSLDQGAFSMVAGEFLETHDVEDSWHGVVTCYCIENSHSIVSYIRRISKILKAGGVWINHSCLDFKYDDCATEPSIQITAEELDEVISRCGLKLLRKEKLRCKPPYAVSSMVCEEDETIFTVAVRS